MIGLRSTEVGGWIGLGVVAATCVWGGIVEIVVP